MKTVRKEKKSARLSMSNAVVGEKSSIIIKNLLKLNYLDEGNKVAAFYSFQNEPETKKLIKHLWSKEKGVYLPVTHEGSLRFFNYHSDSQLLINRFGIKEPDIDQAEEIQIQSIDIILMPLVAFDHSCNRIGMGSGFYDKALSALDDSKNRTHLIGLAYDFQKVEEIKPNKWDIPLDCIVTEKKVYHS
ncbi:MAG: 5-formyltetrahydrofolate cyclo-ligase [Gammaproteobacteria bacterium]|jgi:5-formyltetrahydrofolate cyclo-ligase|nr:5-formyltetrahydrofolate cyclo-ligase [Gammaproteobacteria bacterium]MBQ09619.1 5-formyltetrahydrofolate cyclo-ligase [Gammaproteobacteria bacterium]MDP6146953.1 5-formyltetrahydrofolate cyclo-ligase [Gammaproteobacteria bacterium]HJL80608.1 5-formyltetrahydrofolate cyclo-ligase [Gammaproteobacteria bacterium]HJM09464.1 5-formyltetrahydrofolate cyclo-ligase [Gammaproteobacteria bacterium]|tara:strand:- start:36493 stop:37056 length:564 start_codon:yes stop_codon:yes gene_type:complete